MFNDQIKCMKPFEKIFIKCLTLNDCYTYTKVDSFNCIRKGDIFIVHNAEGPIKNSNNGSEFEALSNVYIDELGIPKIDVRPANELEKRKLSRTNN